jgi:hypothetical protein
MANTSCRTLIKIKSAKHMYSNITVDRLEQIDREREQTLHDTQFIQWMRELNVASRYTDRTPVWNAQTAMGEWDITRFRIPIKEQCM